MSTRSVERQTEDETNLYASQAHSEKSVVIYDPNNSSYANAVKPFENLSSEYMVEFYIWIYHTHAAFDSFPLCVLWYDNTQGGDSMRGSYKSDVSLYLHQNGNRFQIYVENAIGNYYTNADIDSTDRWYKIQLYRHPHDGADVVDLYLDGELKYRSDPINPNYLTNTILLGTTSSNPNANGEVFYDDIIISESPKERKLKAEISDYTEINTQKTLNTNEVLSFLSEANSYFSRIQPYLIYRNYHYFKPEDIFYVVSLSHLLNTTFENLTRYERFSYFDDLVIKTDQIKLGLLYGNLNEVEKGLIKESLQSVIDAQVILHII